MKLTPKKQMNLKVNFTKTKILKWRKIFKKLKKSKSQKSDGTKDKKLVLIIRK